MARPSRSISASSARVLLAAGVALALADASIVTLALPEILNQLGTDVEGVAAVIGVYTVVLAVAVLAALPVRARVGNRALTAAGMLVFAAASVACGLADALPFLLVARAVQAVGAGAALIGAYALLHDGSSWPDGGRSPRAAWRSSRLWVAGAIFGTAIGPALGGALTELFDWRAIFLAQAPIAALAGLAALVPLGRRDATEPESSAAAALHPDGRLRAVADPADTKSHPVPVPPAPGTRPAAPSGAHHREAAPSRPDRARAAIALALVSAALTAVVFLLVLMLVAGWAMAPLSAALAVSILPVAALVGYRIPGNPWVRACAGSGLIAAGILALTAIATDDVLWIVLPQLLAGVGMGLALPALAGELLPERTPRQAASLLSWRHVGITMALLILAPITATQLDETVDTVRIEVTALVLDARLPPDEKIGAIRPALSALDPEDARGSLRRALEKESGRFAENDEQAATYAALIERADDTLIAAVDGAFRPAFLITGGLALLATLLTVPTAGAMRRAPGDVGPSRRPVRGGLVAGAVCAGALVLAGGQVVASHSTRPDPVVIADPCVKRELPSTGGIGGVVQDVALRGLDRAACNFGSSREELTLAIVSEKQAKRYEQRYGADPRSVSALLNGAVSGGGGLGIGDILKNVFK
ncbi:MAG: MFS transporter [Patulibacter sp.]|nr:MFS transporter [Patulibacter sp.]